MGLESITKFINAVSFFDAFNENEKKSFWQIKPVLLSIKRMT
jgi:hypothetical protein